MRSFLTLLGIIVGMAIQVVYIALVTPGGTVSADVRAACYIGIPLAIANVKMIPITCFPFGKDIVDSRSVPPGSVPLISI